MFEAQGTNLTYCSTGSEPTTHAWSLITSYSEIRLEEISHGFGIRFSPCFVVLIDLLPRTRWLRLPKQVRKSPTQHCTQRTYLRSENDLPVSNCKRKSTVRNERIVKYITVPAVSIFVAFRLPHQKRLFVVQHGSSPKSRVRTNWQHSRFQFRVQSRTRAIR